MITIDLSAFVVGAAALNREDSEQLFRMMGRVIDYENKADDDTYVPQYWEVDNGGVKAVLEQAKRAMAKKILWMNTRISIITKRAFVKGYVDMDNKEDVNSLCHAFISAVESY